MIVGIGVDIVELSRFQRVMERHKERFVQRVFTAVEQEYCQAHADPIPHYAVRFAAKEALFKAVSTGWAEGVTWRDVEIVRQHPSAPTMILKGEAGRISISLGARAVHVSLSHSEHSAIALVILES
jgi:holo-[acyl-carrier protein] synthase